MIKSYGFIALIGLFLLSSNAQSQTIHTITADQHYLVVGENGFDPQPGAILEIQADRTEWLKILGLEGTPDQPIRILNSGGQVHITTDAWGALELKNCKHVIISGSGDPNYRYGFKLEGKTAGLGITELSSDITVEYVEIAGIENTTSTEDYPWTFFGIVAKKDYHGNLPPDATDFPVFDNLIIHDNYIHDVHEGMYLGETKSPGMEMRAMRIYNNVVINTYKEAIQVANTVTDFVVNNNFLMNSGREGRYGHDNLLQIGDNSQGQVFDNILIGCPAYGLICFGTGQIEVRNNFFENNLGIFCDDRLIKYPDATMYIEGNYFRNTTTDENDFQVIKYYNQFMDLYVTDNVYNVPDEIIKWGFINMPSSVGTPVLDENNVFTEIVPVIYELQDGVFNLSPDGPESYIGMGPLPLADPTPEIGRIVLDKSMVQILYGRTFDTTGKELVDEQHVNPLENEQPDGKFWNPKKQVKSEKKNKKGEDLRHCIIKLDKEYFIEEMYLFDQKKEGIITLSYLIADEWIEAFTDPLGNTDTWNQHSLQIETQAIRLTVEGDFKGRVNEIALYGYEIGNTGKSASISSFGMSSYAPQPSESVTVYPNPATYWIDIKSSAKRLSTDILDSNGRLVIHADQSHIPLDNLANGLYFVRSRNLESDEITVNRLVIQH